MRIIRQFILSVIAALWVITDALIFILCIQNISDTETHVNGDDLFCLVSIGFLTLIGLIFFLIDFHDELKKYNEKRDNKMKENMILRSDIANMLKQYECEESWKKEFTKSDLEFIKQLLLPVKATLIKGLQNYNVKRNLTLNEYAYGYADRCIQNVRDGDLYWALEYLTSFFDIASIFITYCSYSELIVGTLLVSNILGLCDKRLTEIIKTEQQISLPHGKHFIKKCVSDGQCIDNLEYELRQAGYDFYSTSSFKDYFDLTDEEYNFIRKSMLESFRAIIACRRNDVSIKHYEENIQDKISCFFSALGAPDHPIKHNLHSER